RPAKEAMPRWNLRTASSSITQNDVPATDCGGFYFVPIAADSIERYDFSSGKVSTAVKAGKRLDFGPRSDARRRRHLLHADGSRTKRASAGREFSLRASAPL